MSRTSVVILVCLVFLACSTTTSQVTPSQEVESKASAKSKITEVVAELDEVLLKGTIEVARRGLYPQSNANVTYDKESQRVRVTFSTPQSYNVNYGDFYGRWRHNQWAVLQEFEKAAIPVSSITVETNFVDGSAVLRVTHKSDHIAKYANSASDEIWLRTGEMLMKSKGSNKWDLVPQ